MIRRVEQFLQVRLAEVHARVTDLDAAGELTPRTLLALMIESFDSSSVPACDRAEGGDMLLVQWGVYDWNGEPQFEFELVRQFLITTFPDGPMWQLPVTLRYEPGRGMGIEAGGLWNVAYESLEAFREAACASAGYRAVADAAPCSYALELGGV